ncbi:DUF2931 family protein [Psychroserpens sp. NJDZ02]|uniref:DUF2931 family protein n=1 Tax=Psychroserpens sp. NJDZ02 TaxID=2570561 RepID=UPI0010A84E3A|nr:DUF2931 family protein [Psychroserpens sp. NJDZ02]QCE43145.1 DUF2931 family protein [Psychroserpens sp. NJDZ02]
MKLLNKMFLKIQIIIVCLAFLSCKNKTTDTTSVILNKKEQKFDWLPTECAPKAYPIEIVNGTFSLDNKFIASIPSGGRTVKNGWGKLGSTYIVGEDFKAVPDHLDITWMSYAENKFYKGSFKLPYDKMLALFNETFIDNNNEPEKYSRIVCGMAPGGIVSIWLLGGGKITEIDHFKATETDLTMKEFNPSGIQDREKYVKDALNSLTDEAKIHLQKEGITYGLWTEYRKRYNWKPIFKQVIEQNFLEVFIDYVNGEHIFTTGVNPELKEYNPLALPKYAKLYWEDANKNVYRSKLYFNEDEVKKAFKTINNTSENKKLDLVFEVDKYNGKMEISLKSDTEIIKLEKTTIKIFETTK